MTTSNIVDKVAFLILVLAGLGFLMTGPAGNSEVVGIVVTTGGLLGLLSAHTLGALLSLIEKNFPPPSGTSPAKSL